jgi:hypothetical protein
MSRGTGIALTKKLRRALLEEYAAHGRIDFSAFAERIGWRATLEDWLSELPPRPATASPVLAWVQQETARGWPPKPDTRDSLERCRRELKDSAISRQALRDACRQVSGRKRGRPSGG